MVDCGFYAFAAGGDEDIVKPCLAYQEQSQEMVSALEAAGCTITEFDDATYEEFKAACEELYKNYEADGTWTKGLYDQIQEIIKE